MSSSARPQRQARPRQDRPQARRSQRVRTELSSVTSRERRCAPMSSFEHPMGSLRKVYSRATGEPEHHRSRRLVVLQVAKQLLEVVGFSLPPTELDLPVDAIQDARTNPLPTTSMSVISQYV